MCASGVTHRGAAPHVFLSSLACDCTYSSSCVCVLSPASAQGIIPNQRGGESFTRKRDRAKLLRQQMNDGLDNLHEVCMHVKSLPCDGGAPATHNPFCGPPTPPARRPTRLKKTDGIGEYGAHGVSSALHGSASFLFWWCGRERFFCLAVTAAVRACVWSLPLCCCAASALMGVGQGFE